MIMFLQLFVLFGFFGAIVLVQSISLTKLRAQNLIQSK